MWPGDLGEILISQVALSSEKSLRAQHGNLGIALWVCVNHTPLQAGAIDYLALEAKAQAIQSCYFILPLLR
ncbi:MAG: hypothetical protein Roseis2KO_47810 [Roseivirga sp.]